MDRDPATAAGAEPGGVDEGRSSAVEEGPAFEVLNPDGASPFVLTCDHAGRRIPERYRQLGLDDAVLRRHIAWDIGAADVTRRLSAYLDATAVFAGFSRLLVDCNRDLDHPTSIPGESDGIVVPGNLEVGPEDSADRVRRYFEPYHRALAGVLESHGARAGGGPPAMVAMHSFTPIMDGYERPWHIGVLWNRDPRLAKPLMALLSENTDLVVGENEPYTGRDMAGYSIHHHGGAQGIPHVLLELRQDLVDTHHGAETWANRLGLAFSTLGRQAQLFAIEKF